MTLYDLLKFVDSAYDPTGETKISDYVTENGHLVDPFPTGDTLALFVARELHDTFDPTAANAVQLKTAAETMCAATDQLHEVWGRLRSAITCPDVLPEGTVPGVPTWGTVLAEIDQLPAEDQLVVAIIVNELADHLGSPEAGRTWLMAPSPGYPDTPMAFIKAGGAQRVLDVLRSGWGPTRRMPNTRRQFTARVMDYRDLSFPQSRYGREIHQRHGRANYPDRDAGMCRRVDNRVMESRSRPPRRAFCV